MQSFRFGRKTLFGPANRFIGAGETIFWVLLTASNPAALLRS
jgi:hypothetical protein